MWRAFIQSQVTTIFAEEWLSVVEGIAYKVILDSVMVTTNEGSSDETTNSNTTARILALENHLN